MASIALRRTGWGIMTFFALAIAAYAAAVLVLPGFGPAFVQERRVDMPLALYAHLTGGAVAMALGPWQFNARLRERLVQVHRWTGRCYVTAVLMGATGALALATRSQHGLASHVGFGLLAIVWLLATSAAYWHIRHRDIQSHRLWMIRSYALTLAAVTLRIYLPLSQMAGVPFPGAYQAVAWLCWVPNLIVAEWWFVRRARESPVLA